MGLGFKGDPDKLAAMEHRVRSTAGMKNKIIRTGVEKIGKSMLSPHLPDKVKDKVGGKGKEATSKAAKAGDQTEANYEASIAKDHTTTGGTPGPETYFEKFARTNPINIGNTEQTKNQPPVTPIKGSKEDLDIAKLLQNQMKIQ